MAKIKKFLLCALSCVTIFCIGLCLTGCDDKKDEKCDVTIRIKNNFGKTWVFTPDIEELTYEFEYTGKDMEFYVDAYKLTDEPDYTGDKWIKPDFSGPNVFKEFPYLYGDGENWFYEVEKINERGWYHVKFIANSTSTIWNFRSIGLIVRVI